METANPNLDDLPPSQPNVEEARLRARVASAIAAGGGVKEMFEKTGIPKGTMEKYAAQTSTASFVNAAKIAAAAGVTLDQIAFSEGDISRNGAAQRLRDVIVGISERGRRDERPTAPIMDFNQPDFVRLPIYNDVHASAGPGTVPASEQADGVVAFTRRFLSNQGARPDHCSVIWARGTSMKPTIPDGALLVVDHSQREVEHGCIYVFNVSDRLLVKRARWRLDGRLELVSDNTDEGYPVETFGAESVDQLRVVGRVVYFGRTP
ncbi:S24 family peptidase [Rhodobacter capsulatus]|uniref:S24 family peptidase n=1 Tax=Rhodobacter capsulatus TaxID=1061 RepID=UPI00402832A2